MYVCGSHTPPCPTVKQENVHAGRNEVAAADPEVFVVIEK